MGVKKQTTRYSIQTEFRWGKASHSLGFWYNPRSGHKAPENLDPSKLSDAKKTLEHCRKAYPKQKHRIQKVVTIVEYLGY